MVVPRGPQVLARGAAHGGVALDAPTDEFWIVLCEREQQAGGAAAEVEDVMEAELADDRRQGADLRLERTRQARVLGGVTRARRMAQQLGEPHGIRAVR